VTALWAGPWRWELARETKLNIARSILDKFRGTSVEQGKDYVGMANQIAAQQQAIQPHLDAIKTDRANQAMSAAAQAAVGTPVTATKLFNDYHANEVSADDEYKGRRLLVTGIVNSIDKDLTGSIIVRLTTSNQFMSVDADMRDSQKSNAATLSRGQKVSVSCTGAGMVIGSPQLSDCALQSTWH